MRRSPLLVVLAAAAGLIAHGGGDSLAAEFVLKDGRAVEGEILLATRNTLTLRRTQGGLEQISLGALDLIRVTTATGETLSGAFAGWEAGELGIEVGGRVVRLRGDRVVSGALPNPGPVASPTPSPARPAALQPTTATPKAAPSPVAPRRGTPATGTVVLRPTPTSEEILESDGVVVVELRLSRPPDAPLTVRYTTIDGDAIAGSDYLDAPGELTIEPGLARAEVATTLVDDDEAEGEEVFYLVFSADVEVEPRWLAIPIVDDDGESAR